MFYRIKDTLPKIIWLEDSDDTEPLDLKITGGVRPIKKIELTWGELEFIYEDGKSEFRKLDIDYQWHIKKAPIVSGNLSIESRKN